MESENNVWKCCSAPCRASGETECRLSVGESLCLPWASVGVRTLVTHLLRLAGMRVTDSTNYSRQNRRRLRTTAGKTDRRWIDGQTNGRTDGRRTSFSLMMNNVDVARVPVATGYRQQQQQQLSTSYTQRAKQAYNVAARQTTPVDYWHAEVRYADSGPGTG